MNQNGGFQFIVTKHHFDDVGRRLLPISLGNMYLDTTICPYII